MAEYAKYLLSKEQVMPDTKIILKEFELSNVDPKPYAYAKDITGEATSKLVNQENTIQTKRVLSKNDWLNLQAICGG